MKPKICKYDPQKEYKYQWFVCPNCSMRSDLGIRIKKKKQTRYIMFRCPSCDTFISGVLGEKEKKKKKTKQKKDNKKTARIIICDKCKNSVDTGDKFCRNCGAGLKMKKAKCKCKKEE